MRATESGAIPGDGAGAASCAPVGAHRAILAGLHALERTGQAGVLAVVLRVSGSTYRKPGALVLLDAAGVRAGALSGGCLEADLERLARAVLDEGAARVVRFDTSGDEDRVFGTGSGCGGTSEVLLAPVPAAASPLRDALFAADARGLALELAFDEEGAVTGRGEARVAADVFRFDRDGTACVAAAATALLRVQVPAVRRALLLGAGPETRPLLALLRLLDWQVELFEHRARWSRHADPSLDRLHDQPPEHLADLLAVTRFDAALAMYHNVSLDARALHQLAASTIGYVGLLGPPARRDDLLREIGDEAAARLAGRLRAPVGLPLGGEGAEAIALSIAAELQQVFAGRRGR